MTPTSSTTLYPVVSGRFLSHPVKPEPATGTHRYSLMYLLSDIYLLQDAKSMWMYASVGVLVCTEFPHVFTELLHRQSQIKIRNRFNKSVLQRISNSKMTLFGSFIFNVHQKRGDVWYVIGVQELMFIVILCDIVCTRFYYPPGTVKALVKYRGSLKRP